MFSYIAFKSIKKNAKTGENILISPVVTHAVWREIQTPYGNFFLCRAGKNDLERGLGVFAASFIEATNYTGSIFLVAPDPACRVVLSTAGWRAEQAFALHEVTSVSDAHKEILYAFLSGYPQVPEILAEALLFADDVLYSLVVNTNAFADIIEHTEKWQAFLQNAAAGMPKKTAIMQAIQKQPALINEINSGLILAKALPFVGKDACMDIAAFVVNKSNNYQIRFAFVTELLACSRDDALPFILTLAQNDASYFAQTCKALLASEYGVKYFSPLSKGEKMLVIRLWAGEYVTDNIRYVLPDIIVQHAVDFSDNPVSFCNVVLDVGANVADDKAWADALIKIIESDCSITIRMTFATLLIQHYRYAQQILNNLHKYFETYELLYVFNVSAQRTLVPRDVKIAFCRNYITVPDPIVAANAARWYIELTGDYAAFSLLSKEAQRAAIEGNWDTEILAECVPFADQQVGKMINSKIKEEENDV